MPYYIFRIKPFTPPEKLCEFGDFKEASAQAKAFRTTHASDLACKIKVMFADDVLQAEDLLCQIRTPGPKGDD